MNIFLLALIILVLGITFVFYTLNNQNVIFLTHEETSKFLLKDEDRYIRSLSAADLFARKVTSADEYLQRISRMTLDFTEKEKTKLRRCCMKADAFFKKFVYMGIDCDIITKYPWKLALTDVVYEEGLPHTRTNIIFLSKYNINDLIASDVKDEPLVSTLIHEKVHIFQRYNPTLMQKLIDKIGFTETKHINKNLLELKRSNPDVNNKIYFKNTTNKVSIIIYKSDKPSGINDIRPVSSFAAEHPYEMMAYEIAGEYDKFVLKNMGV